MVLIPLVNNLRDSPRDIRDFWRDRDERPAGGTTHIKEVVWSHASPEELVAWGLAKTHLQHLATAAAINLDRLGAWFEERPLAKARVSRFARLAPLAA